jgi:precorrin-6Y C5,15-methyltransferase (decarboxylating)
MSAMHRWLTLVGIGEDGREGLSRAALAALDRATLVVGGKRHLALAAPLSCETLAWPSPIGDAMPLLLARCGENVVVLATGDPFHYGIGTMIANHVAPAEIASIPQPSAFSLAASRLCWSLQDVALVSLHGRDDPAFDTHCAPGAKILVLSWDGSTPANIAARLCERGMGASVVTVLEAMGGPREKIRHARADAFDLAEIDPLNTIAVRCEGVAVRAWPGTVLPDDAFVHDGQITKQDIRAITLAALAPVGGECLWDVGAGSGSISIEWLRAASGNRGVAIEARADRSARIAANAKRFGFGALRLVEGRAPEAFAGLPAPDAIFVGGGASDTDVLPRAMAALRAGGRLVVNAVTLETQALLSRMHGEHGGHLVSLQIAEAAPIGRFSGWRPAMPIVQWRWRK